MDDLRDVLTVTHDGPPKNSTSGLIPLDAEFVTISGRSTPTLATATERFIGVQPYASSATNQSDLDEAEQHEQGDSVLTRGGEDGSPSSFKVRIGSDMSVLSTASSKKLATFTPQTALPDNDLVGPPSRDNSGGSLRDGATTRHHHHHVPVPSIDYLLTPKPRGKPTATMGFEGSLSSGPPPRPRIPSQNAGVTVSSPQEQHTSAPIASRNSASALTHGSFSWRTYQGASSGVPGGGVSSPRALPQATLRSLLMILSDYKHSIPETLTDRVNLLLGLLNLDGEAVLTSMASSNDLGELAHQSTQQARDPSPSNSSIVGPGGNTSPHTDALRQEKKKLMVECRPNFEDMSPDALVRYCTHAHSSLVLMSEIVLQAGEGARASLNSNMTHNNMNSNNNNNSSTLDIVVGPPPPGGGHYPPGGPHSSASATAMQHHNSNKHISSRIRFAVTGAGGGATAPQGIPPASPSGTASASIRSQALFEQSSNAIFQSMGMSVNNAHSSVASQYLEPFQETTTLNKTTDELGVKMLNNYVMMDTLGQGACGKVKLGYDVDKGLSVAIKIVRKAHENKFNSAAKAKMEALQREVAVMKKLRHKNLVSLLEVIDDPDAEKLYLVMQFVDDGPIAKMNPDGTCATRTPAEVAMYARQVCAGLEYLHTHDIVHRDIKPENILVSSGKQAFVADFGVSEMFSKADGPGVRGHKGTPMFMAPEMWQAKARERSVCRSPLTDDDSYDEYNDLDTNEANALEDETLEGYALDVWALGVTFYMLLMGRPPYTNVEEVMTSGNIPAPSFTDGPQEIPADWCALIKRMMSVKPYKRPQMSVIRNVVKKIDKLLSMSTLTTMQGKTAAGGLHRKKTVGIADVATAFTPLTVNPAYEAGNSLSALNRAKSILVSRVMTSFQLAPSSRNGSPRNSQQHDHVGGGGGGGGLRVSAGGGGTSHGIRFPGGGNATSFSATGSDPLGDSTLQGIGARVSSLDKGSGGKRADEVGRSGSFDTGKGSPAVLSVSSSPGIAVATLEPSPPLSVPAVTPAQQNSGKKTHESGSALRNRIMGFGGPPSAFGATLKYD